MWRHKSTTGIRWLGWILGIALLVGLAGIPVSQAQGAVNVSQSAVDSRAAVVAVTPAGTVHVVWEEPEGLYHRWMRNNVWSSVQQISLEGARPTLLVDRTQDDVVYLAWDEPFGEARDVFVRRWDGQQWSLPRNVSQSDGYSTQPSLAQYADGTLVLVWTDTTPGTPTLFRATSDDGLVWKNVSPVLDFAGTNPQVQVVNGVEHLIWTYRAGFRQPRRLLWSYQDGNTWRLPEVLSAPTRSVEGATTLVVGDTLWLAWSEVGDVKVKAWRAAMGWSDTVTLALAATGIPTWVPFNDALHLLWPDDTAIMRARWRQGLWSDVMSWQDVGQPVDDVAAASRDGKAYIVWSQQADTSWDVWLTSWTATRSWVPFVRRP